MSTVPLITLALRCLAFKSELQTTDPPTTSVLMFPGSCADGGILLFLDSQGQDCGDFYAVCL